MESKDYKALCEEYEKRMGIGQHDPAKDGYLVLIDILRQQNDYLKNFKIKSFIASEEKGDQLAYKNAKELWEKLPDMIGDVNLLKITLKMEGEEQNNLRTPISATSLEEE